jgi:hypothetical protein
MYTSHSNNRSASLLVLALVASACSAGTTYPVGTGSGQDIVVEITPRTSTLAFAGQQAFVATVTGTSNTSVAWMVQEGAAAGTISGAGLYTAPSSAGTFHVVATSVADPTRSASATITVQATAPITVTVAPRSTSVAAGGRVTFSATVTGTSNTAVAWSVQEGAGCGVVTSTGVYTAPATAATCHVVATSAADTTRTDTATVSVTAPTPISVTISPATPTVDECQVITFSATVSGSSNQGVLWSIVEGVTGGAVTPSGVYTAPASAGTYHVMATSLADASRSATATVVVSSRVISVTVSPGSATIPPGGTAQFTATVTTTCGTFTASQTINSAGAVVAPN